VQDIEDTGKFRPMLPESYPAGSCPLGPYLLHGPRLLGREAFKTFRLS
jgi:hypothetical protein